MGATIGGVQKSDKSIRSSDTFLGCGFNNNIVDFYDISIQTYGQLIICIIIFGCAIGSLQKSGKSIRSGDTL